MTRNLLLAITALVLISTASTAFADDYTVNCEDAARAAWAQCIVDRMGDADGDE